jgi:hypothetical protein
MPPTKALSAFAPCLARARSVLVCPGGTAVRPLGTALQTMIM